MKKTRPELDFLNHRLAFCLLAVTIGNKKTKLTMAKSKNHFKCNKDEFLLDLARRMNIKIHINRICTAYSQKTKITDIIRRLISD